MAIWLLLCVLLPIHLLTMGTMIGAQFWALHLRANGFVSKKTPAFMPLFDPVGAKMIEGFYSDRHALYSSPFITRCVKITRIALPLDLAAFAIYVVAAFMRL